MNAAQVLYLQNRLICSVIFLWRIYIGQLTSNHLFYDLIIGNILYFPGSYICTISHDGNIVCDLTDLSHLMADIYHRNASGL